MDSPRVRRRVLLAGFVGAAGSLAGCVDDDGEEDVDAGPAPEFGYGGEPVIADESADASEDRDDEDDDRGDAGGGSFVFPIAPPAGEGEEETEDLPESEIGLGEQGYGMHGYGGVVIEAHCDPDDEENWGGYECDLEDEEGEDGDGEEADGDGEETEADGEETEAAAAA